MARILNCSIYIFFVTGRFHESINDCTNAACFSQSVAMLSVMNTSVDPCQDFYQFACGRKDRSSLLDILTKNVDEGFNLDLQKILGALNSCQCAQTIFLCVFNNMHIFPRTTCRIIRKQSGKTSTTLLSILSAD